MEQILSYIDKSGWAEGEWKNEPDYMRWVDVKTQYPMIIRRNSSSIGVLCGYVGVPEGHPLFGSDQVCGEDLSVHGGITYSEHCDPGMDIEEFNKTNWKESYETYMNTRICHPKKAEEKEVFWFGFDCGHAFDRMPGMEYTMEIAEEKLRMPNPRKAFKKHFGQDPFPVTYRNVEYVKNELRELADQLKALESKEKEAINE